MSTTNFKRILRRLRAILSSRTEVSLAWQLCIVLALCLIVGAYALWVANQKALQPAAQTTQPLRQ